MSEFTKDSWLIVMQPSAISPADNTTYYVWGNKTWTNTPTTAFQWFAPESNMILHNITFYSEGGGLASTEPSIFSIEERYNYANAAAYPTNLKKMIISKNFTWNFLPHPLGFLREFLDVNIEMVRGRLYALRLDVPTMATNPAGVNHTIILKGSYRVD